MNRKDFKILDTGLIYFDNGATTLKPTSLMKSLNSYYTEHTSNAHRGDYKNSIITSLKYDEARVKVQKFINAKQEKEIIFTSGTTDSLNKIIFGFFKFYLDRGDEVLLSKAEHASVLLPWFELAEEKGIIIKYIPLDQNNEISIKNIEEVITNKTKVISLAHITNVIGDIRPIKKIVELAKSKNILTLIDGAQSVPHMSIDVQDLDIDFLTFSAHKMCGPTGVGVLYGKEEYLKYTRPTVFGGGMNATFKEDGTKNYKNIPYSLEPGTQNIAGVIAFGEIIDYLKNIGMDKIHNYELELKAYAIKKLSLIPNIEIYNNQSDSGILTFNYKGVFAQDIAVYLDRFNINVRSGNHCAKILTKEIGVKNTVRASFYFYNTLEEIDKLYEVLQNNNLINEII